MAFARCTSRSILREFALMRGARCARLVFGHHTPRASTPNRNLFRQGQRSNLQFTREYHGGGSGGAGQNWDGLVYSIMSNLRGQTTYGPECFYRPDSNSDSESDSDSLPEGKKPRDVREEVPLQLNRASLKETAGDIVRRLRYLAQEDRGSEDYEKTMELQCMLIRLANLDMDDPKLELQEYADIWLTIRDGIKGASELPLRILTVAEKKHLQQVQQKAERVWGVSMINAAIRRLEGVKVRPSDEYADDMASHVRERREDGDSGKPKFRPTFEGDLRRLGARIHGLLLDSKDFWPEGERWFSPEEEERILEAVWRVWSEGKKRDL